MRTFVFGDEMNPHGILLSEVMTKERPEISEFIELARRNAKGQINLDGYSLLIAQTSLSKKIRPSLEVSLAIDLSGLTMAAGQEYAVVGRKASEMETNDIIDFAPSRKFQLIDKTLTSFNWLSIHPNKQMIVFLVYHKTLKVFEDAQVWYFPTAHPSLRKLAEPLLSYIKENLVDVLIINGIAALKTCPDVEAVFIPEILNEIQSFTTPSTAPDDLSINRGILKPEIRTTILFEVTKFCKYSILFCNCEISYFPQLQKFLVQVSILQMWAHV